MEAKNRHTTPKIIAVVGPTASGKSDVAVELAKKFGGEVVSADSRQIYKGLDIGSGKITKKEMKGVPHHMLDIASPRRVVSVAEYKRKAEKAIDDVIERGKLPILCGGTGFYIQAVVDNAVFPEVPPNQKLRAELASKTTDELFAILKKLDPRRAKEIDPHNPHRLIRAIEIARALGAAPHKTHGGPKYRTLQIGIKTDDETLKERIRRRLLSRMRTGMVAEARRLHERGLSWKRMEELGLEYRYLARYLRGKLTKEEMIEKLNTAIWHYARRQKTWFKRDKRVKWFELGKMKKIEKEVEKFLK